METKLVQQAWLDYRCSLLRYIENRTRPEEAEDILLQVFEKLLQQVQKQEPKNLPAWLYRVTQNAIVDYYRLRKFEALSDEVASEQQETHAIGQLAQCIEPMIRTLPETYAQVLYKTELDGLKHKDVAESLGLSLTAVKSRVLRGKEKLRQALLHCCAHYTKERTLEFQPQESCCQADEKKSSHLR